MLARAKDNAFSSSDREAVYRAVFTRRDIRSDFVDDPVEDAVLARLILAAHHAPSVGFMQPWNFIVIRDMKKREQVRDLFLAARLQEETHIAGERQALYRKLRLEGICESALNLCVTCDRSRAEDSPLGRWHNPEMDLFSTVCAVQNLWLAARAEGIGVGWVSIMDQGALKSLLRIPDHVVPVAYLCIGRVSGFAAAPELQTKGWRRRLAASGLVMSEFHDGDGDGPLKGEIDRLSPAP
jgi:5,6-dimethylbenzimidazole synthase